MIAKEHGEETPRACTKCGKTKPVSEFYLRPNRPCGYQSHCRECQCLQKRQWRKANNELARSRDHRRRQGNLAKHQARELAYNKSHREERLLYQRIRHKKNPQRSLRLIKLWARANPQRVKAASAAWQKRNLRRINATRLRRRRVAMPPWVNREEIAEFYVNCPPGYVVDHVVPLKGLTLEGYAICGLHVPWNFQYLLAAENRQKGNTMLPMDHPLAIVQKHPAPKGELA